MVVLDTNTVLRLIVKDLPRQAKMVEELIHSGEELFLPEVIFPEIVYNLSKDYSYSRQNLVEVFGFLIGIPNLIVSAEIKSAIVLFNNSKLDMADCIVAAYARGEKLASFDKELLKLSGAKKYWS